MARAEQPDATAGGLLPAQPDVTAGTGGELGGAKGDAAFLRDRSLSDRLPTPWLFPILVFAVTWGLILAAWQVANMIYRAPVPWSKYFVFGDGISIQWLAVHGYATPKHLHVPPARAGFFPVLPELVKTVSDVTNGDYLTAGVVVQVVTGMAAAVAVWALAARLRDRQLADRTVLLFCAFPGALSFAMLYPQALGAALAAVSLLAAVERRWLAAGVPALIAAALHPLLIALFPALAVTALHALRTRREWRALIAPVLAPFGVIVYFVLLGGDYGNYLYWFRKEYHVLGRRLDWGVREFHVLSWTDPATNAHPVYNAVLIAMFVALVAGIALMFAARLPLPVTVYTVTIVLMLVLSATAGPRTSSAWLALGIFPAAGAKLPRWIYWPLLVASAGLLVFLAAWWPHQLQVPRP